MIALFKESAMRLMNDAAGKIVPFHMFYDALEQFLDHSHKGVIIKALDNDYLNPNHEQECFDVNVLKTLFMIKYRCCYYVLGEQWQTAESYRQPLR